MTTTPPADDHWDRMEALFATVLDLPVSERQKFLDDETASSPELGREVRAMVSAHESAELSIESRLLADAAPGVRDPMVGRRIGPYRLEGLIGVGGMGSVYRARRVSGEFDQTVAIKVTLPLRYGADQAQRFRLERQVLARLEHPNIASLLDGGVTGDGLPYLVMQIVDGVPITEYCDRHRLGLRERLVLFQTVCAAVEYAHAHLIVHRDLKPSNILVNEAGEVKLLDFGIVKLLDPGALDLTTMETRSETRVATPLHAAPEQLAGEAITTATDVYALGLLLYELLTGRLPYQLDAKTPAEVERAVREREPERPSTAIRTQDAETASVRRTTPRDLARTLRGDLERIVLMALRKEPERRYVSAGQLSEDMKRYLAGQPVNAHHDSAGYRLRRFVGRHRAGVATASLAVAALISFGAYSAIQARRLSIERDRLELERRRSDEVVEVLVGLFEAGDPERAQGENVRIEEFLRQAEEKAESLTDQPQVQARLLHVLGQIYTKRDRERAGPFLERALAFFRQAEGEGGDSFLSVLRDLADLKLRADHDDALKLLTESLELHRARYGERDPRTLKAEKVRATALEPAEAIEALERVLAIEQQVLAPDDVELARTMNDLALQHWSLGRSSRAESLLRDVLSIVEGKLGRRHPNTLAVLENLHVLAQDPDERESLIREVLETRMEVLGPDAPGVANAWANLGVALARKGDLAAAAEALTEARQAAMAAFGPAHWRTANVLRNLGRLLQLDGRPDEALPYLEEAVRATPSDHWLAEVLGHLAVVQARVGRPDEALATGLQAVKLAQATRPQSGFDSVLMETYVRLGQVRLARGEPIQAQQASKTALDLGGDETTAAELATEARIVNGQAAVADGRFSEGLAQLRLAVPLYAESWRADPVELAAARELIERSVAD